MGADELIDAYLYDLRSNLAGTAAERDRIAAETEDHLWEAWERYIADGVEPEEAARRAIDRFGRPDEVAAGFPADTAGRRIAGIYFALATLFGSALITIGLTAMFALPVHAFLGADFLFGPGGTWEAPTGFCARVDATDCQQAWDDFLVARVLGVGTVASLVGGAIIGVHVLLRRQLIGGMARSTLVAGAYLFGVAAVVFLAGGTFKYAFGPESGWNTWLPAGLASMLMSFAYAMLARGSGDRLHAESA